MNLDLAREAFNDYLIQYPGHSRNAEARKFIANLGGRDRQRSFDIAEFYEKSGNTEAAKVYYRDIVKNTGSEAARSRSMRSVQAAKATRSWAMGAVTPSDGSGSRTPSV